MKPVFSIIMAVYNNEKYFPNAVRCVLNQIYKNFELIIVDDGSTDNTPKIADEFAMHDSRVKVIHQKNQWIYASFNNGIKKASGEYIYILNSDDLFYDKNTLQHLYELVLKYNPDVILTNVNVIRVSSEGNETSNKSFGKRIEKEEFVSGKQNVQKRWHYWVEQKLVANQANLYRTQIAQKHPFRNDVYGGDVFFNISIADDVESVALCPYPVYMHYIYNSENMNASIGKYYGYEHRMFNELHTEHINLLKKWSLCDSVAVAILSAIRLSNFTNELKSLLAKNCTLTIDEKIDKIFSEYLDEIVVGCAKDSNREEELESRILSFCRSLFVQEMPDKSNKYYFIYELLENLLRYEKTEDDMSCIKNAVYHENNPYKLGERFYKKLIGE